MAKDNNKRPREDKDSQDDKDWASKPPYALEKKDAERKVQFTGGCHCGDVKIDIYASEPKDAKFCHCDDCQKMHGSAMHWSVALEKTDVHIKADPDQMHFYRTSDNKTVHELPCKLSCARCHSHLADEGRNMMLMYPSVWDFKKPEDRQPFLPNKHIFYALRAIDVHDGMDKWEKMPEKSKKMSEEDHHGQKGTIGAGSKKASKSKL